MWLKRYAFMAGLLSIPSAGAVASCDDDGFCIPFVLQTASLTWLDTTVDGETNTETIPDLQLTMNVDGTMTVVFENVRGGYILAPAVSE